VTVFLSTIGYKQREKISKSLKARVDAIQSALKRYNEAAVQLNPPRPSLTWETVMNAVAVADFDLLRDTLQDIRTLEWAQAANREGMVMYFGIKRAKEEICRLNVEIRRLLTFLYDDYVDHYRAVTTHIIINPPLASEISAQWSYVSAYMKPSSNGLFRPVNCLDLVATFFMASDLDAILHETRISLHHRGLLICLGSHQWKLSTKNRQRPRRTCGNPRRWIRMYS
jgi:hypothetical protein